MKQSEPRRKVMGFVILNAGFYREGGWWVGECQELGTVAQAETLEEAQRQLADMITLHLNTLERQGEQEAFFREFGIKLYTDEPLWLCVA